MFQFLKCEAGLRVFLCLLLTSFAEERKRPPGLIFSDILSLLLIKISFSSSLIIHEEKAKEITAVKEVSMCDPNRPFHGCLLSYLAFE